MSLLAVEGVTKSFGGLVAVNDVSFTAAAGEILSIIGPNGAGKSTLFKLIGAFLAPDAGRAAVHCRTISRLRPHVVARLGVVRVAGPSCRWRFA